MTIEEEYLKERRVMDSLRADIEALKVEVAALKLTNAVSQERYRHIDEKLTKIEGALSRLMWIVLAAVLGGIVTFIMSGGLRLVT